MKRLNLIVWTCSALLTLVAPGYAVTDLVLENKTLVSGQVEEHYAGNSITAGPDVVVQSGAGLKMTAWSEITLRSGFHAQSGSSLTLKITGCDTSDSESQVLTGCPANVNVTVDAPATSGPATGTPPTAISFDGNGDYLKLADSPDWDFGSGDFTIDFWMYQKTLAEATALLVLQKKLEVVWTDKEDE